MKKRSIITMIGILILLGIIIFTNKKDSRILKKDGITYAILVNGKKSSSFPEKGLYRVDTECSNAICKWDYDNWKLYIEEIKGSVAANISFTSIEKQNLSNYIIRLSGTEQGIGQVVNEVVNEVPSFKNASKLALEEHENLSKYLSNFHTETSGSQTDVFSFSESEWLANLTNLEINKYYQLNFNMSNDGYYQICGQAKSGSTGSGNLFVKYADKNSQTLKIGYNTNEICTYLGKINSGANLRVLLSKNSSEDNDTVISFSLQKANEVNTINDYRYEGKNPNNYVRFNDELWRVIGVFDENTHGQSGQNLVKIIRDESIGVHSWDQANVNNWSTSGLKKLLNSAYLNQQDGTNDNYCYVYYSYEQPNAKANCDYRSIGIEEKYRKMIKNAIWHINKTYLNTSENMYISERLNTIHNGKLTADTGYIGLMYLSDYGYSVLADSCIRITVLNNYNNCADQSWINVKSPEWTITTNPSFEETAYNVVATGAIWSNGEHVKEGRSVRPTLYLDSSVYVLDGDGSITNPYIIGM